MIKNYSIVSGATFRQRILREELPDFVTIANNGSFWVGTGNRVNTMKVTAQNDYIELLISNTASFTKGDYEYKVSALNEFGDTVILVYGRIRVLG